MLPTDEIQEFKSFVGKIQGMTSVRINALLNGSEY
jgi:hypothetical protein